MWRWLCLHEARAARRPDQLINELVTRSGHFGRYSEASPPGPLLTAAVYPFINK